MTSTIEWTDETWNPVVGCSIASPGCDHCYAAGVAHRAMQPAHKGLTILTDNGPAFNGTVRCLPGRLDTPLHWRRPRKVFVNSMSDLFHPEVLKVTHPDPWGTEWPFIAHVFATMAATPQHTYQVLTKRPRVSQLLLNEPRFRMDTNAILLGKGVPVMKGGFESDWPPNIWLGTSIELDKYAFRAEQLLDTPAAVRFLSLEPLLGPLPSLDLTGMDWVIVGGESGPKARPMHPAWVRDIRDRCIAAGVPFFFKQWGAWSPVVDENAPYGEFHDGIDWIDCCMCSDGDGCLYRVGKKAGGRELDGRTWDEMPA